MGDEWDADAFGIFRAWLAGALRWTDFFAAHNEHRIALTRIADLVLLIAHDRWNLWWEMSLGAALYAGCAVALFQLFVRVLAPSARAGWLLGLAVLFAATVGWQNALWGFQTHVYFASILTIIAISGMLGGIALTPRWWIGWSAALLALFSDGSGGFAAIAILAIGLLDLFAAPGARHTRGFALGLIAGIVVVGVVLRVDVADHAPLKARNFAQFYVVFARSLGWPLIDSTWSWFVVQAPVLWLAFDVARRRVRPDRIERCALALAIVVVLHAAAIAYGRGAGMIQVRLLSRYQDPFLLGAAANLFILLRYGAAHRMGRIAALGWTGIMLVGLMSITIDDFSLRLPDKLLENQANLAMVREYLDRPDPTIFGRDPFLRGPHPTASSITRVLDHPQLRRILPGELLGEPVKQPWFVQHARLIAVGSALPFLAALFALARSRDWGQADNVRPSEARSLRTDPPAIR